MAVPRKVVLKRKGPSASGPSRRSTSRRPASTAAATTTSSETAATEAAAVASASAGQPPAGRRQRAARRASVAAPCCGDTTISDLSAETLQEVFDKLSAHQGFCREVLPLVCKRFRELLRQPSPVWQELHINFLEKGLVLAKDPDEDASDLGELTSRRRLLRSAVEKWLRPRAAAVKKLVLMFSSMDPTHSFSTAGHGLRPLFRQLPGLQELRIISCSDTFQGASFSDLGALQHLQTLAVTCIARNLTAQDLAPLEQLKQLRSFTLHCSRQAEEMAGSFLDAFPDVLLKLKNLRELALTSMGITHVPPGITRLKSLEALDVSGTAITFLPQSLWKLSELRHVRLNGTSMVLSMMHAWEALAKLPRLEVLELRETKTRSLPVNLTGLKALTSLDLSDNIFEHGMHQGEDALSCLQHLPALKRLELRRSQLSTVPAVCCQLSGLTHLDLSHNFLVDLPEGLWLMRSLKELLAQGNTFPRIPEVLHRLPSLEVADLSFCIYMEAAAPLLAQAAEGFKAIRSMDLRKMLGVWKDSSVKWLKQLDTALLAQGRPHGVLQF